MATGVSPIITDEETAYLTVAEYKNAPTAIDFDNLVVGGNSTAQDAELGRVILRASSFMNEYLNQDLAAQSYTETQRVRMTGNGYIALHPFNNPIISLSSFQYGTDPNNLVTLPDCSVAWFEPQEIIIPLSQIATTYSSAGPLSFGYTAGARAQTFVKYDYVAGYANTTLSAQATAGATSMTVVSGAGIQAGAVLRINDGANQESVTVASTYTYGSTTVPLTSALAYTHASGVAVGNLPNVIKEAAILVTTAFIKARGDNSLTMAITTQPSKNISGAERYGSEIALALDMISKYRRIR
jgi:hypothetical protein